MHIINKYYFEYIISLILLSKNRISLTLLIIFQISWISQIRFHNTDVI